MKNYRSYCLVVLRKFLVIIFLIIGNGLVAQTTIWKEDFTYSNGTRTGTASGVAGSIWNSGNDVSVRSGVLESENEDEDGYWRTTPINIKGFTEITLSFSVTHFNVKGQDKFSFRYRLDGGAWVDLLGPLRSPGNNPGPNYSYFLPAGNILELEALFKTKNDDRHYRLDNILLEGTPPGCPNVLDYEFYNLVPPGLTVDNIPTTGMLGRGQIGNFNVAALQNEVDPGDTDTFSIRYTGYIRIATAGNYTFYTTSDDGSKLYIDGNLVVNNDGDHGSQEGSGTVTLSRGLHQIMVLFYENGGGEVLEVRYQGPGISKKEIPFSILYSDCAEPIVPTDPGDCNTPIGSELVFNGDFSSWWFDGWTRAGDNWQEPDPPGAYVLYESYGSGSATFQQTLTLVQGESYMLTFDLGTDSSYSNSSTFNARVGGNIVYSRTSDQLFADNGGNSAHTGGGNISNTSKITVSFVAPSNSVVLGFEGTSTAHNHDTFFLDNISVKRGTACEDTDNLPPTIMAIGNQSYCPGVEIPIVESVSITDPDDNMMDKVFVQITSNYDNGKDVLALTGTHPGISSSWNASEGKLILTGPATLAAFETALKAVVFNTTATLTAGDGRNFSIVLNEANYLISTGHYYEYVPALGITWTAAKDAAATRTFYGLQGYLATLTIADEAALLGKQSEGAGWIGASDVNEEGKWRWVTGPEAGTLFWNGGGNGNVTAPYNYANWNNGEPNNSGNEHYAHINAPGTGFDGSWNDLSNTGATSGDYQPKGYLVEYGGMPGDSPYPNISAVTSITVNSVAIAIQPVDQIAIVGTPVSFMVSANNADTYQWQVSTDGGASFVDIANGADYSGTKTNTLSIPNSNMTKNGYRYRVIVSNSNSDCPTITSDPAVLNVQIGTVITNKRITYRVKGN